MTPTELTALLTPYAAISPELAAQLLLYLDLIVKWNARVNLTAIRTPEEMVRRHFGESLFAGAHLGPCASLLDFGSGAGFPGLPIQLLRPELAVTLAESRVRKAAFLREAVRTLRLPTEVWGARVADMPEGRRFEVVTLRAVDDMAGAIAAAALRATDRLVVLGTVQSPPDPSLLPDFTVGPPVPLPEARDGVLWIAHRC